MKKILLIIMTLAICLSLSAANGPTEKITVGSGNITDGSIGTIKLADDAVTTGKILDGTILNEDVATGTFAEFNGQATEDFAVKDLSATSVDTVALKVKMSAASKLLSANSSLTAGSSVALETLFPDIGTQLGRLTFFVGSTGATGVFVANSTAGTVIIEDTGSVMATTDVGSKLCLIYDGDNTYTLKNNFAGNISFTMTWMGR